MVQLTVRERQVLKLVADGLTDKEIAVELHIGGRTARRCLENAYHKVGAINRPNVVYLACKKGLL